MKKKISLAVVLFAILLIVVPLVLMMMFSHDTHGKIVVNDAIEAPFLKQVKHDVMIVYFGYVGCTKICTPILHDMDRLYRADQMDGLRGNISIVFVNLMPEIASNLPDEFAKGFNPSFEGIYLTQRELMRVDRTFNLFFSKSLNESFEMNHSDYIYLVQRQPNGEIILKHIYSTHPMNHALISDDIRKIMGEA